MSEVKAITVIDPEGQEHQVPEADAKHFEQKGWDVKAKSNGTSAPTKRGKKK